MLVTHGSLLHRLGVAALAIGLGKSHFVVAHPAVFTVKKLDHGVFCGPFFYPDEDLRMAEFTAVPDRVFSMGKNDIGHPFHLCFE